MTKIAKNGSFSVLIPDGESHYATSIVRCLAERKDAKTIVLSKDRNAPIRFSRYTSKFIYNPYGESKEERLSAIIDAIKKTNADILLPVDVETIRLVSENKEILSNLIAIAPNPELNSFDTADDKWLLSLWLNEHNIPHPNTLLFRSNNSLEEVLSAISFPIIIKPRNGSGGKGIHIVENAEDLQSWYNEFDHSADQIIQTYIKGYDIDCSVICSEGRILAHTIQKGLKYSVDYPWPYGIQFLDDDEIFHIVKEVIDKFNWSGVVHIDLRYDEVERQAKLIEMNPRFWASVTASIFAGINFPYLACLSGLKKELPVIKSKDKLVLRTGPALKMSLMRLFKKQNYLPYDNSFGEFIIKDPLPNLFSEGIEIYNRYKNRLVK